MPKSLNLSATTDARPVGHRTARTARQEKAAAFWILCVVQKKEVRLLPVEVHKDHAEALAPAIRIVCSASSNFPTVSS